MKGNKLRLLVVPAGLLAGVLVLGGCNTVEGMGKDIAAVGSSMSGASRDVRNSDDSKTVEQQARAERHAEAQKQARAERRAEQQEARADTEAERSRRG